MTWILAATKVIAFGAALSVGDYTLCPNQVEGHDDEELNCKVVALVPGPDREVFVVLTEVAE